MRLFLTLLLAVAIPFNAAFAVAAGWCDELQHAAHPGHHVHVHDHEHGNDSNDSGRAAGDVGQDGSAGSKQKADGHHHSHVHPVFSTMLPAPVGLNLPVAPDAPLAPAAETFISAIPPRLERPPRSAPVA
ncbi:MAG: hypothetical protein HY777_06305 [Betaproteobacteria bacterium]|nr:hypothetical protein [Betaproteobacteria bacterium]